jgi:flagellar motor switch protein FliG
LSVDDSAIQLILREIQSATLIIALKGADEAVRNKMLNNLSKRAAEILRDDLAAKGPVRVSEVEKAQREILTVAQRLAEEGQIVLGKGDDFV